MWGFVVGNLGIGLGYPGMPHVVTRYMATRSDRDVQRLQIIAMMWGVVVFYGAGLVGLVGRVSLPDLADGERALMALALEFTHPVIAGLLLAAVISADPVDGVVAAAGGGIGGLLRRRRAGLRQGARRPAQPGARHG